MDTCIHGSNEVVVDEDTCSRFARVKRQRRSGLSLA